MFKVFIVEDERVLREGLCLTTPWEDHGFKVVGCAETASRAREQILRNQPDLVITDIRLPEVSGLEMIESLNEHIMCDYVIISGHDNFEFAQKAMSLGVREYLLKPVDDLVLARVLDKMREVISRRKETEKTLPGPLPAANQETIQTDPAISALGRQYLSAACAYLAEHFQEDITAQKVADVLHISESYLSKLFKNSTGQSFHDTLTRCRMEAACRMLLDSHDKVYQVAHAVGYRDVQHFTAKFRRKTGCTPTVYRRKMWGETPANVPED